MKNIFKYLGLSTLLVYCSTTKIYNNKTALLNEEFVKVKVEKLSDLTFGNINNNWSIYEQDTDGSTQAQNNPNPFAPSPTEFFWTVVEPDTFKIILLDSNMNFVDSLYNDYLLKGHYKMSFTEINLNSRLY